VTVLAPLPRCLIRVLQTSLTPSQIIKAVKEEKSDKTENEDHMNNIPEKKRTISAVWTKKSSSANMTQSDRKKNNDITPGQ